MTGEPTCITRAGRARGRYLLIRAGTRIAELDQRRLGHRLLLVAVPHALRRRFDPRAATDLAATLELRIRHPGGDPPQRFTLLVRDRRCHVNPGAAPNPHATATLGGDDLVRLASGAVGWPELLAAGRLELAGDPYLGLRVPNLFRLPVTGAGGSARPSAVRIRAWTAG